MRFWELVKLAVGGVRRTPLRVALTSLGVAIATGALVTMLAFAQGLQSRIEKPFRSFDLLSYIFVTPHSLARGPEGRRQPPPGGAAEAGESSPTPGLDDAAVRRISELQGVSLAYPSIHIALRVQRAGRPPLPVMGAGVPPEASRLSYFRDTLVAGRFFNRSESAEAVLDLGLAKRLGFEPAAQAVGQTLTLEASGLVPRESSLFGFENRKVDVAVVGVADAPRMPFGRTPDVIDLPLQFIKQLPGLPLEPLFDRLSQGGGQRPGGYQRVMVSVTRLSEVPLVEKRIRELGFDAWSLMDQVKGLRTAFVLVDALLAAVGAVALFVAALGIINTLLMAVLERYAEIGAYKAIGASDGDVRTLFLAEAGLVGLIGGLGGVVLGRGVSWLIGFGVNAYARSKGVEQQIAAFEFPLWLVAGAILFAVAASVVSGVYPASRASRVDPIRALRGE